LVTFEIKDLATKICVKDWDKDWWPPQGLDRGFLGTVWGGDAKLGKTCRVRFSLVTITRTAIVKK